MRTWLHANDGSLLMLSSTSLLGKLPHGLDTTHTHSHTLTLTGDTFVSFGSTHSSEEHLSDSIWSKSPFMLCLCQPQAGDSSGVLCLLASCHGISDEGDDIWTCYIWIRLCLWTKEIILWQKLFCIGCSAGPHTWRHTTLNVHHPHTPNIYSYYIANSAAGLQIPSCHPSTVTNCNVHSQLHIQLISLQPAPQLLNQSSPLEHSADSILSWCIIVIQPP